MLHLLVESAHDNCNNNGNKKAPFPHGKGAINRDILSIQIIQP